MFIQFAFLFCLGFSFAYGSPCSDLTGTWRNQLGSNMTIQRIGDTFKITGRYNTSVESSTGAASISSNISGLVKPVEGGSLVAFNVLWNKGNSLTAWVGQCLECDGQERIYTTWVLTSLQTAKNRWMSTRINQDTFWRVDNDGGQPVVRDSNVGVVGSEILGQWKSVSGDSIDITSASETGSMEGLHKTSGSTNGSPVFGSFDGNATYSALGFASAGEQRITGWAGHVYNPQETNQRMETSWLSYAFSHECNNPRKKVKVGFTAYTKE